MIAGNIKQYKEFSNKIEKLLEDEKEKFCRPVVAFVIFDNQECQERCLEEFVTSNSITGSVKYNESGKAFTMLEEKLELEEATEPSDIIWENLAQPNNKIFRQKILVYLAMLFFLFLLLSFLILIETGA